MKEKKNKKIMLKCPNSDCGIELDSPYHTICPVCAEPISLEDLRAEKQGIKKSKKLIYTVLGIIILLIAIGILIAFI